MINHRTVLRFGVGLAWVLGATLTGSYATAAEPASAVVAKLDKDSDKTLDWDEVQIGATARFDRLNKDSEGTLDAKELSSACGRRPKKLID